MSQAEQSGNRLTEQARLRDRLARVMTAHSSAAPAPIAPLTAADVVITPNEVNDKHGTGILVKRLFGADPQIVSIRSMNTYGGEHQFGSSSFCISHQGLSRWQSFQAILNALQGLTVKRIVCIPFQPDDVITALVLKELFDAPLCTYILDDQNVHMSVIPDELMRELLTKSSLRLAVSPEMRDSYETKYRLKTWILPPVVDSSLVQSYAVPDRPHTHNGVLIGNVWSQYWFDLLLQTLIDSNLQLEWYKNNDFPWLAERRPKFGKHLIERDFIANEADFVERLRDYAYAVVPSGTLDANDPYRSIGQLSLPSRIPQILATTNLPIVVLGSPKTAAAHFVDRFQLGAVCDYDPISFKTAVAHVTEPQQHNQHRQNAAAIARTFADAGIADWIWKSLDLGQPCDDRFEQLLHRSPDDLVVFLEPPHPPDIFDDFAPIYRALRRLTWKGFQPDFVLDVGASVGVWSYTIAKLFPQSRFLLVDPLASKYDPGLRHHFTGNQHNFESIEVAISNYSGQSSLQVSGDLYGSSLLHPEDFRDYESVEIEVTTLDDLAIDRAIRGRGLLKIDVQCAEHLVLEGAKQLLEQVDVLVIELSLVRYDPQAKVLPEMIELVQSLGFRYADDAGEWRSPVDGTLLQKDILFIRGDLYQKECPMTIAPLPVKLTRSHSGLPAYREPQPLYNKVLDEVTEEVQRVHRYYLDFQMQLTRQLADEMRNVKQAIAELNRRSS